MDLLKTPSMQSLVDSDLESVDSLQYMDFEELDEVEYALPVSEAPTLAEVLLAEDEGEAKIPFKPIQEPTSCSAVQVDFLQAVSQQLLHAQDRSSAGAATALSVGSNGKLTVGTAHGHLLSFFDQTLRWVCDANTDRGAVSCLAYNQDSTRLLAGYARGMICQYESIRGIVLRRVTLGGELWGTLRVTWAGNSGLALDTGGSVWLIKFSRPLGVRSARASCLFSGARGEVVAMAARDARILALATLSRVIIVAGGRAAGVRLGGPPDTLPVLAWSDADERVLVCARSKTLQWLAVNVTGTTIQLRPVHKMDLKSSPLWLGWLGGSLAIFDADENLRLWGEDYDKPLDLSQIEPVYASAFFKGLWTDGRVSRAMCMAGGSALGGACVSEGTLSLLGRKGVVRVRPRDLLARAQASMLACKHSQALRLLCLAHGPEARDLANSFIVNISDRPHLLSNKILADLSIKVCLKFDLGNELWSSLWEQCANEQVFVEALGEAAVRGELSIAPPSPDYSQELIERLADCDPGLVERVVASLPLTSLDPHRASVFTRNKKLWRGVGAIAAALGGPSGAMRELVTHVAAECRGGESCRCGGGALLLAAADALAGRGAGGRPLPDHAQPSARHDALHALLAVDSNTGRSPLRVLAEHDARACVRLLEQSARDPPFAGPLGKQNRLRVARALLYFAAELQEAEERAEILEFITGQLNTGALPADREVTSRARELAASTPGERADRAWLALLLRAPPATARAVAARAATVGAAAAGAAAADAAAATAAPRNALAAQRAAAAAATRPRVLWRLDALLDNHQEALAQFFQIECPSNTDLDELFEYLHSRIESDGVIRQIESYLSILIELRPRAAAALITDRLADAVGPTLRSGGGERAVEFAESLLESGRLNEDAALAHLRNLCVLSAERARNFLVKNVGLVRPEHALAIVREAGARRAEPVCLEATGDPETALGVLLELVAAGHGEERARLVREACELCTRVASSVPAATASEMWERLLKHGDDPPPTLLLEAAAFLPVERLTAHMAGAPRSALAVLCAASGGRQVWASAVRVVAREAHETLARTMAQARRGLAVRGRCVRCGGALAGEMCRTTHCARACHATCDAGVACVACGRRLPDAVFTMPPPRLTRTPVPFLQEHKLQLVAPPRPDLEGVV